MKSTNKTLEFYKTNLEHLTTYATAYLFTSDTPSEKEKKHERRCQKVLDSFYGHNLHTPTRELLRDVETSFLLGCNTIVLPQIMSSCGRLQARFENHVKTVQKACKQEKVLLDYYQIPIGQPNSLFCTLLEDMLNFCIKNKMGIPCDLRDWKTMYYNAYKQEKKEIKNGNS